MDYVLIPGAGGRAWYWHLLAPGLAGQGHRPIAVELPAEEARRLQQGQTVMARSAAHPGLAKA